MLNFIETKDVKVPMQNITIFFIILLAYIIIIQFINYHGYIASLVKSSIFAFIIIVFLIIDFSQLKRIFSFKYYKPKLIAFIVGGSIILAIIVHYFAGYLNELFYNAEEVSYLTEFDDAPLPLLFAIITVGIFPAIFEEIGFRGIVFNNIRKISNIKTSILISAILFTLLHLSFISFIWIFPIGLAFGYLRARYRTLWYGIIGHFCYNSSIVLFEYIDRLYF